jgi:hypothetical protein
MIKSGTNVAFCKKVAERIGLGFEPPSKNAVVGPNGPTIKSEPVSRWPDVLDPKEINSRVNWVRTVECVAPHLAVFRSFACCKLPVLKELVGASGFEPPTSWSRTMHTNSINALSGVA